VGGVSERPAREQRGEILLRPRVRFGGRHPDLRDAGNLRGGPEQRGSRSVRHTRSGARSPAGGPTDDNRCPLEEGGGERRRHARGACTRRDTPNGESRNEDTSFTRSRDPCTSIGTRIFRKRDLTSQGVHGAPAVDSVSKSGKPTQVGGTGGGAWSNGRSAARRASPLLS